MKIYQVEITNKCNLSCDYCPRNSMTREIGTISDKTLQSVYDNSTNNEIRLHHFGESLIEFEKTLYATKLFSKKMNVILNTNGTLLDSDKCLKLFENGMHHIFLSYHTQESLKFIFDIDMQYRKSITVLFINTIENLVNMKEEINSIKEMGYSVQLKRLRNLGQICSDKIKKDYINCSFIKENEFVVAWNGDILTCCECFNSEADEVLGNINVDVIENNQIISKCHTCFGYGNDDNETERVDINDL